MGKVNSMSRRLLRPNKGSLTVEATLVLPIFLFAFFILISFANQARTESILQHAISQTAKEVSTYLYVTDKLQLERQSSSTNLLPQLQTLSELPSGNNSTSGPSASFDPFHFLDSIKATLKTTATQLAFSETMTYTLIKPMFEKNISQELSKKQLNQFIESLFIKNGVDGISFSQSSALLDGKTINVIINYEMTNMFPDLFNQKRHVRQIASTTTWGIHKPFLDEKEASKWSLSSLSRGRAFLEEFRNENSQIAVAPGVGIDLYEDGRCTFIYSFNPFSTSYSERQSENQYELNDELVRKLLKEYAEKSRAQIEKLGDQIEMLDGEINKIGLEPKSILIQMIVPEEANQFDAEFYRIAKEIEQELGIEFQWSYREKAF